VVWSSIRWNVLWVMILKAGLLLKKVFQPSVRVGMSPAPTVSPTR